ncbi:hypothetical protein DERP_007687 [Dermatophagoides pteronyssinus]|uniref:Uncharacterized protein n=1 Tax=Dermatophagoides pteronyssinus TaxID=6956 RepID=A0ABQ8JKX6_DERPT|nr:hypothetical protein DERP_007687 [Dermatophagoides pteronyssinus]
MCDHVDYSGMLKTIQSNVSILLIHLQPIKQPSSCCFILVCHSSPFTPLKFHLNLNKFLNFKNKP